jgi:hypothetical protein
VQRQIMFVCINGVFPVDIAMYFNFQVCYPPLMYLAMATSEILFCDKEEHLAQR